MEKPEEKKPNENPNRPPRPPVGGPSSGGPSAGKKSEGIPKGPVPPRGQSGAPRPPLPGQNPQSPLKPMTGNAMPKPMPGLPGGMPGGAPAPFKPTVFSPNSPASGQPPMTMPMPGGKGPAMPPAMNKPPTPIEKEFSAADSAKDALEGKVQELEKKLMEEREKVLLASLRSKEEEAISSKVESSIKDIQDKLRRDRKEQDMDEARRKAEERVNDVERRLAEEREAWVSTLKGQLNQRDQVTQEMETHFSSRLKDLEYRWSQEKSILEEAVRVRDAEIIRIRQEHALKSEQEKAFWEDRLRAVAVDRDKMERELDRARDKYTQEKEQLTMERQSLKENIYRLESAVGYAKKEAQIEATQFEKEVTQLNAQVQAHWKDVVEKNALIENLKNQLSTAQNQLNALQIKILEGHSTHGMMKDEITKYNEKIKSMQEQLVALELEKKRQMGEVEEARESRKKFETAFYEARKNLLEKDNEINQRRAEFDSKVEDLSRELSRARLGLETEVARVQNEADARVKTLQVRLDWYDSNADREYTLAREKVHVDMDKLEMQLGEAQKKIRELSSVETANSGLLEERNALQKEVEQLRGEWKQSQWDMESRFKELQDELKHEQAKQAQMEDARLALEQEIKQRDATREYEQTLLAQRTAEIERLQDSLGVAETNYESAREKMEFLNKQIDEQKQIMQGRGMESSVDLKMKVRDAERELDEARKELRNLKDLTKDADKAEELFKEKERVLKTVIDDKQDTIQEFKTRIQNLDRALKDKDEDIENLKNANKKASDRLLQEKQNEMDQKIGEMEQVLNMEKNKLNKIHQDQLEQIRQEAAAAADQARGQMQDSAPAVDTQALENQIRQQLESEKLNEIREAETLWEDKLKKSKDEVKKEIDKYKWEIETLKGDLKKAREARAQIEREAQELLQQADEHYRVELERKAIEIAEKSNANKGLFSAIGHFLDTPILDTKKKKEDK